MTPIFKITIGGTDITSKAKDRLLTLRVTDEAGMKSDAVQLVLDNRNNALAVPRRGVLMFVALGYAETGLVDMGIYTVDEVSSQLPNRQLTIAAKATDMQAILKVKKTRAWPDITLGGLVTAIAEEHGLEPKISDDLALIDVAPIPYRQLDQTNETDLHLLTRMSEEFGAVFKIANGFLLFVRKGESKAASGQELPAVTLGEKDITGARARAADRGKFVAVKAYYMDADTAERVPVIAGAGEPMDSLRRTYPDAATAEHAAAARLDALKRGTATLNISMPGKPEVGAETRLIFNTPDTLAAGEWVVTRALHELSGRGGLVSRIEAQIPKAKS